MSTSLFLTGLLAFFVIGAIFGSFFYVVGTRMPENRDIVRERSKCDHCGTTLKWYELIPIFSYCLQLGKCNTCGKKIASGHLILELATAFLFAIGFAYYGLNLHLAIYLILISVSLIIFVSDFKYMVIMDSTIVVGSIIMFILKYFESGIKGCLLALIFGLSLFFTMYLIKLFGNFLFKKECLGGGDIKLAFLIGLSFGNYPYGYFLGLIAIIFASFLALPYAIGVIYFNKKNELPFGPFLIASCAIIFVFLDKFSNLLIFFGL